MDSNSIRAVACIFVQLVLLVLTGAQGLGYPVDVYYPQGVEQSREHSGSFILSTPCYELRGDPGSGVIWQVNRKRDGRGETLLAPTGMSVEAVASSILMSSTSAKNVETRMCLGRHGPLYNELIIKDVPIAAGASTPALMTDVVLHCYSEKLHVVVTVRATRDVSLDQVLVRMPFVKDSVLRLVGSGRRMGVGTGANPRDPAGYLLEGIGKRALCALTTPLVDSPETVRLVKGSDGNTQLVLTMKLRDGKNWRKGESRRVCFALLFPADRGGSLHGRIQTETHPDLMIRPVSRDIPALLFKGYQEDKGFYLVEDAESRPDSYHGLYPYPVPRLALRVVNPSRSRSAYICISRKTSSSQLSGLPVVTDGSWLPTGEQVQLSRKWERPRYSESYFDLRIGEGESRVIGYRTPRTWWGEFPSVQMSGLDLTDYFDMGSPWWECSMGESEFICYEFNRNDIANIADFRPIDGRKLSNNHSETPWFRNAGGGELLKYRSEGTWQSLQAKRTRFISNGPSLVHAVVEMFALDGKASARVEIIQPPCRDYNRVFFHLRYDLKSGIPVDELRLLALNDEDYPVAQEPQRFGYLAASGEMVSDQSTWNGRTIQLHESAPFVFVEGDPQGCKGVLIRSVRGRIGGSSFDRAVLKPVSADRGIQRQILAIVPDTMAKETNAGDYAELEIEVVGWGGEYA
ncbi:MAG: hypothetical protein WCL39_07335, partial [Armatimonadota bacterium]